MDAETWYFFTHAVLRDAVYQLMLPGDRAALHRAALDAGEAAGLGALAMALHARAAQEEADGPTLTLLRAREDHWLAAAAREANARADMHGLLGILARLAELRAGTQAAFEILVELSEVARETGNMRQSEAALEAAARLAGDDVPRRRRVTGGLVGLYIRTGRLAEAERLELEVLAEARDSAREQEARGNLAVIRYHLGRYAEAERDYRQARRLAARNGTLSQLARYTANLALLLGETGRVAEAEAAHRDALRAGELADDRQAIANTLGNFALLLTDTARFAEAESLFHRSLELEQRAGLRPAYAVALANYGRMLRMSGRPEDAEGTLLEAAAIHREVANLRNEGTTLGQLADMQGELGRYSEALANFERGLVLVRAAGDRLYTGVLLGARGRLRARMDDVAGARQDLAETEQALADAPEAYRENCLYPLREAVAELSRSGR